MIQTEMDALAAIDVFSLKVLFFQYRPRDGTLEELVFFFKFRRMHVLPCAHVCIMKRQKANSLENITWSELEKQNIQDKKVYCQLLACYVACVTYAI